MFSQSLIYPWIVLYWIGLDSADNFMDWRYDYDPV